MRRMLAPIVGLLVLALAGPVQAGPSFASTTAARTASTSTTVGSSSTTRSRFEGVFMLKAPRSSGAPPYLFDNYETHEIAVGERSLADDRPPGDLQGPPDHARRGHDLPVRRAGGRAGRSSSATATATCSSTTAACCGRRSRSTPWATPTSTTTSSSRTAGSSSRTTARHPGFYFDFCAEMEAYFFG